MKMNMLEGYIQQGISQILLRIYQGHNSGSCIYLLMICFFEYGDIREDEGLIRVVFIDNAPDCDRILLDFLFEYLKLNPNDYFWTSVSGCRYTYEDIKKIKQNDFDPLWCYKNPHADDIKD